ncbi:MAG: TonB-dependent receptor [Acidobacteriota bacterium]|nr:TonB-dependent receptor [Acidobacteriota bacterium]
MKPTATKITLGICLVATLLVVPQVMAQNPLGEIRGTVKDDSGASLPGVTVTALSASLQGERSTVTGGNGDYKVVGLPGGQYEVSYELEGFATVKRAVKISAAQTAVSDIAMQLASVTEEIVVTALSGDISETGTAATTYTKEEVESLPIARTILATVNLAPGVHDTGPSTAPSINGAMSFENLFMINGVPNVDNVRGTPLPLFIEDAVQETTTSTSGVSAEYGRFTGGVVNVITKSGGNDFSGSARVNYTNDDWISKTPLSGDRVDDISHEEEETLGGFFWKDHIWFFGAGRQREQTETDQTVVTNITYPTSDTEDRTEYKLTLSPHPSHSIIGSQIEIERTRSGSAFGSILDTQSLNDRQDPQEIESINYTGILTSSFFLEAQTSDRFYSIALGLGGPAPANPNNIEDLIPGTLLRDRPSGRRFWSSTFCRDCEPTLRNAENTIAKGSYFLTTDSGSHDLVFGYDSFSDITQNVNHQSGSDFQVWADRVVIDGSNNVFPVFESTRTWLVWWPPVGLDIAQEADFTTDSFFANDSWQLNDKWSFNIGVRYDENDGVNSSGVVSAADSKVSPRLGLSYDVKGDGDLVVNASYGTYVAAIASSGNIADGASTGGALAGAGWVYSGPNVNENCQTDGSNCVGTDEALRVLFNWYTALGGETDAVTAQLTFAPNANLIFGCIPGVSNILPPGGGFSSPSADEITVGVTKRLGTKGLLRADLVFREWEDFYSELIDVNLTGTTDTPAGVLDVTHIGNFGDNVLERDYLGLNFQARYRFNDKLTLSGNYTWSQLEGNINGETSGSGPVPSSPNAQPEYHDPAWAFPVGPLASDQEHKLGAWLLYDIVNNEHHSLNVSLLQSFFSGTPYSTDGSVDSRPYVTNPGYASPPSTVAYFFNGRGDQLTDDITRTDLALNYSFQWNAWGKSMEVFLQPEIINIFNEDGIENPVDDILDNTNDGSFAAFNPFTTTPVRGTHYDLSSDYGQADDEDDFQDPREYRFSIGFRF